MSFYKQAFKFLDAAKFVHLYFPFVATKPSLFRANDGAGARLASLNRMLKGRHQDWSRATLDEMRRLRDRLTPENRRLLEDFAALAGPGARARLQALRRGGFYRQGGLSQAALWLAAALGRV